MVEKPKGLSPRAEYLIERHGSVLLVWFLLLFMSWSRNGTKLLRGELSSNDDYMRMVEIRDWLGGQNWFDMHQYRLNPVDPLNSHWSRISDVLIGGPIKILSPVLGSATAELVMVIVYPSLLLLAYLYLATALAGKLVNHRITPVMTAFMLALSFGALSQFGMGRIDHHGLQIVMALATCWLIVTSPNKPKRLVFAGILCGLALYIGIESAPYVAAACIAVVLIWVFGEDGAAQKIRYFGLALAGATVVSLLISTPPSQWFAQTCDALSVVYTQLALAVAMVLWGLGFTSAKFKTPMSRFGVAAALGALALIITGLLYPHCLKGPYAGLDQRLVEIWLSNVAEAGNFKAFLMGDIPAGLAAIIVPILAVIGYVFIAKNQSKSKAITERTLIIFIVLTLCAGFLQMRLMFFATALAIPFASFVLIHTLVWAGKFEPKIKKITIRAGLILVFAPVTLPLFTSLFIKPPGAQIADKTAPACNSQPVLAQLNALPVGTALTQIDLGAPILNFTKLSVTSAPYHRNASGMLAALDMFIEDETIAKRAAVNMKADYVVACIDSPETHMILKYGPNGMLAQLIEGKAPRWLEPIDMDLGGVLLVYRVKHNQP